MSMDDEFVFYELQELIQTSTVAIYEEEFRRLQTIVAAKYTDLDESYFIQCCIFGFIPEIQKFVQFCSPSSLESCFRLARIKERLLTTAASSSPVTSIANKVTDSSHFKQNSFEKNSVITAICNSNVLIQNALVESIDYEEGSRDKEDEATTVPDINSIAAVTSMENDEYKSITMIGKSNKDEESIVDGINQEVFVSEYASTFPSSMAIVESTLLSDQSPMEIYSIFAPGIQGAYSIQSSSLPNFISVNNSSTTILENQNGNSPITGEVKNQECNPLFAWEPGPVGMIWSMFSYEKDNAGEKQSLEHKWRPSNLLDSLRDHVDSVDSHWIAWDIASEMLQPPIGLRVYSYYKKQVAVLRIAIQVFDPGVQYSFPALQALSRFIPRARPITILHKFSGDVYSVCLSVVCILKLLFPYQCSSSATNFTMESEVGTLNLPNRQDALVPELIKWNLIREVEFQLIFICTLCHVSDGDAVLWNVILFCDQYKAYGDKVCEFNRSALHSETCQQFSRTVISWSIMLMENSVWCSNMVTLWTKSQIEHSTSSSNFSWLIAWTGALFRLPVGTSWNSLQNGQQLVPAVATVQAASVVHYVQFSVLSGGLLTVLSISYFILGFSMLVIIKVITRLKIYFVCLYFAERFSRWRNTYSTLLLRQLAAREPTHLLSAYQEEIMVQCLYCYFFWQHVHVGVSGEATPTKLIVGKRSCEQYMKSTRPFAFLCNCSGGGYYICLSVVGISKFPFQDRCSRGVTILIMETEVDEFVFYALCGPVCDSSPHCLFCYDPGIEGVPKVCGRGSQGVGLLVINFIITRTMNLPTGQADHVQELITSSFIGVAKFQLLNFCPLSHVRIGNICLWSIILDERVSNIVQVLVKYYDCVGFLIKVFHVATKISHERLIPKVQRYSDTTYGWILTVSADPQLSKMEGVFSVFSPFPFDMVFDLVVVSQNSMHHQEILITLQVRILGVAVHAYFITIFPIARDIKQEGTCPAIEQYSLYLEDTSELCCVRLPDAYRDVPTCERKLWQWLGVVFWDELLLTHSLPSDKQSCIGMGGLSTYKWLYCVLGSFATNGIWGTLLGFLILP